MRPISRSVYLSRLQKKDARAIARLEKAAYANDYRSGREALEKDLSNAERDHENLSIGLFDGRRLIGFVLAFHEHDRRSPFATFGAPIPPNLELPGESVYVADMVVQPGYPDGLQLLLATFVAQIRRTLPGLPIDAFVTETMLSRWKKFRRGLASMGLEVDRAESLDATASGEALHWMETRQVAIAPSSSAKLPMDFDGRRFEFEIIEDIDRWEALGPEWARLLEHTAERTPFMSLDYLATWWDSFGIGRYLYIIAIYEASELIAIAPLMRTPTTVFGRSCWSLEFIGDPNEVDRPMMLGGDDPQLANVLLEILATRSEEWDLFIAYEQSAGGQFANRFKTVLGKRGYRIGELPGPDCPFIQLNGDWSQFMAQMSRGKRKDIRRKRRALERKGTATLAVVKSWPETAEALENYADIEQASWKPSNKLGVEKSREHWAFYRRLVERLTPLNHIAFSFLEFDGKRIAGTIGLVDAGRFASLHIAHDASFDRYSPGVVLTAMELEHYFDNSDYREYDFLGGFLANKQSWASEVRKTVTLYAYARRPALLAHYQTFFVLKPLFKSALRRIGMLDWAVRGVARTRTGLKRMLQAVKGTDT